MLQRIEPVSSKCSRARAFPLPRLAAVSIPVSSVQFHLLGAD